MSNPKNAVIVTNMSPEAKSNSFFFVSSLKYSALPTTDNTPKKPKQIYSEGFTFIHLIRNVINILDYFVFLIK